MKPVAQALNILQGETNHSNAYMGYLAPTITILRDKLSKKLDIPVTKPLVQELLNGIDKRFDSILNDKKIAAAAILHPKFKESWSSDCDVIERGISFINEKLEGSVEPVVDEPGQSSSEDQDEADFFQAKNRRSQSFKVIS
ncbi:zinc finger BED domain-containing 1 [Paramuricea clavata]|uniref:Zinc finger BED domain-containing 1 n=1 Tax=Paramuricea clavata TaxID=317549 RepID=A0A6S7KFD7_PARCT|nr:zinc finger BED domain-containing 1 [Paramuricea clavata]